MLRGARARAGCRTDLSSGSVHAESVIPRLTDPPVSGCLRTIRRSGSRLVSRLSGIDQGRQRGWNAKTDGSARSARPDATASHAVSSTRLERGKTTEVTETPGLRVHSVDSVSSVVSGLDLRIAQFEFGWGVHLDCGDSSPLLGRRFIDGERCVDEGNARTIGDAARIEMRRQSGDESPQSRMTALVPPDGDRRSPPSAVTPRDGTRDAVAPATPGRPSPLASPTSRRRPRMEPPAPATVFSI